MLIGVHFGSFLGELLPVGGLGRICSPATKIAQKDLNLSTPYPPFLSPILTTDMFPDIKNALFALTLSLCLP